MIKKIFQGVKSLPRGIKSSVALFLASMITKGISYITTPLFTRMLSSEEYGTAAIFYTWMQVFGVFAMFNLSAGVFNNGMVDYPDKRDEYSLSMLGLSNILSLVFSLVLIVIYPFISKWIGLDIKFIYLMIAMFFVEPAYSFWISRQRYELKYKASVTATVIIGIISPLISIIAIKYTNGDKLVARLFGAQIPLLFIYLFFYFYIATKGRFHVSTKYWKGALLFNLPLIPHYLSVYLLSSSDRIMISQIIGPSETAYYSVAYSVASLATIVWSAMNASLVPFTYENCKNKNFDAISNVASPILTLFTGACLSVILLAPEVIKVMATPDYLKAVYVIPPVVGGVFFQVLYSMFANIIYYYKKPKYVMYSSVLATVTNLLLNYIFINKYGFIAAGYTTLICYVLQAFVDWLAMRKVIMVDVYGNKKILLLSGFVIFVSLSSNLLYSYTILRYIILIILLSLVIVFRRKIVNNFLLLKKR